MKEMTYLLYLLFFSCSFYTFICYPTFDEYISDFQKVYTTQEYNLRKNIYNNRIAEFNTINSTYTPGVNNFTDWTQQQISQLTRTYTDPSQIFTSVSSSSENNYLRVSVPDSLDWRTNSSVTSVKNQGSCGSCWAFAAVAHVESKLIIQKGYGNNIDLSEQFLVSCTPRSDCNGGYISQAVKLIASGGLPYQSSFPYNPYGSVNSQICSTKNKIAQAGSKFRYQRNIGDTRLIQLLQNGPLIVQLSAQRWSNYGSGIFTCPSNATVDHAVLLVGYTSSYWIIKNQWARTWGQSGYMKITRQRTASYQNCYLGYGVAYLQPIIAQNSQKTIHFSKLIFLALIIFTWLS